MKRSLACLLLVLALPAAIAADAPPPASTLPVPAGHYRTDLSHTSLLFRVNHLGFSNYTARFKRLNAELDFDPQQPARARVTVTVDARSLETDFPDPAKIDFNAMLQGADWLDTARHPEIRFRSTRVEAQGRALRIHGELTLRGVTRPIVLDATYNGGYAGHPFDPQARIGFSARGTLRRSDFGFTTGIPAAGTTLGVSDAVEVIVETEMLGPALPKPAATP